MLEKYLKTELILPDLAADSQEGVLHEFAELIAKNHKKLTAEDLENALAEREHLDSTGIQDGFAIPHAKLEMVDSSIIAVGRSSKGINFHAHDDKVTHIFFVMVAPAAAVGEHIKLLARIAKLLAVKGLKEELMKDETAEEMYNTLLEFDAKL